MLASRDDSPAGPKTLEELKAERTGANWSWKQKPVAAADHKPKADNNKEAATTKESNKKTQEMHISMVDQQLSKLKVNRQ